MGRKRQLDLKAVWQILKDMYKEGQLTYGNVKASDKLPSTTTINNYFGNTRTMKDSIERGYLLEEAINRKPLKASINGQPLICKECVYDYKNCKKDPRVCEKEAEKLYYKDI